jgi:general secretion pathway protein A
VPNRKESIKALIDALNRYLLDAHADGRRTILVVDEAQNLAPEVLEEIRLLTNLETSKQKLLQIILIGQPELRELLARNDLRQLAQRITGRYHLEPLSPEETDQYIEHRLKVAGALGEVFDASAKRTVFRLSQGVPRLINVICDRALLGAYSQGSRLVSRRLVRRAAAEISGEGQLRIGWRWTGPAVAVAAALVLAVSIGFNFGQRPSTVEIVVPEPAATAMTATSVVADDATEPEQSVSLNEQLEFSQELTSADTALSILFEIWNIDVDDSARSRCAQATSLGYSCLSHRGSWSGLRQLDRPAILQLVDRAGRTHHVVLTSISGERAELSIGGVSVSHPVSVISELWFGTYQLLWRPPNGVAVSLLPDMRNSNVVWLRESLAAIDERYRAEPFDSNIYDQELQRQVREFQRDQRLDIDGLAGQQTQIIINSLLEPDSTPRLTIPRLAQE